MSHGFCVWLSYGAAAVAVAVEIAGLLIRRSRALARIEEERDLETQD